MVGISVYREQARWGRWDVPAVLLPADYIDSVARAGGAPVLLPSDASKAEAITARIDAMVLSGGGDLDPAAYGARPHRMADPPRAERDRSEMAYLEAAVGLGLPVLGICRGLQLINVARGGTLVQHLPDIVAHERHSAPGGVFLRHSVTIADGTLLAKIMGTKRLDVETHHHQAVDRLGAGLVATAWAEDGTIEAAEDPDLPFLVAVQWHPEAGSDASLFDALVAAASSPPPT